MTQSSPPTPWDSLREFLTNGCDARTEDRHHALQNLDDTIAEIERLKRAWDSSFNQAMENGAKLTVSEKRDAEEITISGATAIHVRSALLESGLGRCQICRPFIDAVEEKWPTIK